MDFIDVKGTWVNEFGSQMVLSPADPQTGIFSGTYSSHTGATGVYYVTGITDIAPDPKVNSQTIAFSISWRNIPSPTDEGCNWCSAFAGQIQMDAAGNPVMPSTYLMQKNTDPADNWGSTIVAPSTFTKKS